MMRYRLSAAAESDIVSILQWTHTQFGEVARRRYQCLLVTALRDIASDPARPGSVEREELGKGARSWHLVLSTERARSEDGIVHRPRHLLIYRVEAEDLIVIGRILHDAMELEQHMTQGASWE
ncbi:type II toxin-antitoxin system RelE/ParE family toxin [Acerihabitans arboris]|uniref:Type II toxin-antitoxin system RelE/ParE family toxin n=1 Tax=Acerihabitans arboris TaxID=2691583 RepID=A0A845SZ58_9GAMM|nr:type II toxin-antitoxin system RelE/ParE family toxin [Acerihabitans arboris]NDL66075.1 type II toxin-antitoxin system RelE/ParE family toxin [Acerihabitans arboris]